MSYKYKPQGSVLAVYSTHARSETALRWHGISIWIRIFQDFFNQSNIPVRYIMDIMLFWDTLCHSVMLWSTLWGYISIVSWRHETGTIWILVRCSDWINPYSPPGKPSPYANSKSLTMNWQWSKINVNLSKLCISSWNWTVRPSSIVDPRSTFAHLYLRQNAWQKKRYLQAQTMNPFKRKLETQQHISQYWQLLILLLTVCIFTWNEENTPLWCEDCRFVCFETGLG